MASTGQRAAKKEVGFGYDPENIIRQYGASPFEEVKIETDEGSGKSFEAFSHGIFDLANTLNIDIRTEIRKGLFEGNGVFLNSKTLEHHEETVYFTIGTERTISEDFDGEMLTCLKDEVVQEANGIITSAENGDKLDVARRWTKLKSKYGRRIVTGLDRQLVISLAYRFRTKTRSEAEKVKADLGLKYSKLAKNRSVVEMTNSVAEKCVSYDFDIFQSTTALKIAGSSIEPTVGKPFDLEKASVQEMQNAVKDNFNNADMSEAPVVGYRSIDLADLLGVSEYVKCVPDFSDCDEYEICQAYENYLEMRDLRDLVKCCNSPENSDAEAQYVEDMYKKVFKKTKLAYNYAKSLAYGQKLEDDQILQLVPVVDWGKAGLKIERIIKSISWNSNPRIFGERIARPGVWHGDAAGYVRIDIDRLPFVESISLNAVGRNGKACNEICYKNESIQSVIRNDQSLFKAMHYCFVGGDEFHGSTSGTSAHASAKFEEKFRSWFEKANVSLSVKLVNGNIYKKNIGSFGGGGVTAWSQ